MHVQGIEMKNNADMYDQRFLYFMAITYPIKNSYEKLKYCFDRWYKIVPNS